VAVPSPHIAFADGHFTVSAHHFFATVRTRAAETEWKMKNWGHIGALSLLCVSATAFTAQYVNTRPQRSHLERELDCITRQIQAIHSRVMCDEAALENMTAEERLEYERLCKRWRGLQQRIGQAEKAAGGAERGPLDHLN
jgi:hypothetical protein